MSGTRNGQQWPPRGSVVDLPDEEARQLCEQRMARPYVEVVESRAVVEVAEDSRVLGDPAAVIETVALPEPAPARGRRRT